MKAKFALVLALVMLLTIGASASGYAEGDIGVNSFPADGTITYKWEVKSITESTSTRGGSYSLFYVGEPAVRKGETDTVSISFTGGVIAEGVFQISKGKIAGSIGISLTAQVNVSASKTSAPLNVGQYVKAYWRPNWKKWTITQQRIKTVVQYEYGPDGAPIDVNLIQTVVDTKIGYMYRPILPQISLTYFD